DHAGATLGEVAQAGQQPLQARGIADPASLEGNVEIGAHQHALAVKIETGRRSEPIELHGRYRSLLAAATTSAGVMRKCSNSFAAGAEAPNCDMPTKLPRSPIQRSQPCATAASTARRGAEPSTALR